MIVIFLNNFRFVVEQLGITLDLEVVLHKGSEPGVRYTILIFFSYPFIFKKKIPFRKFLSFLCFYNSVFYYFVSTNLRLRIFLKLFMASGVVFKPSPEVYTGTGTLYGGGRRDSNPS
jgi:hypothetical protein